MDLLRHETPKARKDHYCDGAAQIDNLIGWSEVVQLGEKMPESPHKINKGETYIKQTIADGGEVYTWKSCQHCHGIISRHRIFDD